MFTPADKEQLNRIEAMLLEMRNRDGADSVSPNEHTPKQATAAQWKTAIDAVLEDGEARHTTEITRIINKDGHLPMVIKEHSVQQWCKKFYESGQLARQRTGVYLAAAAPSGEHSAPPPPQLLTSLN